MSTDKPMQTAQGAKVGFTRPESRLASEQARTSGRAEAGSLTANDLGSPARSAPINASTQAFKEAADLVHAEAESRRENEHDYLLLTLVEAKIRTTQLREQELASEQARNRIDLGG